MSIWRQFNKFLIRLDFLPEFWEDRVAAFAAYLIDFVKVQSSTLRSYISAIKHMLRCEDYEWCESRVWLGSLIRSCKLTNDVPSTRFPIHYKLLEIILFEVQQKLASTQPYLESLYMAIFMLSYYGLMRISENAEGPHAVKVKNIYIGQNKNKIRLILYSSKTHDRSSRPQEIKISGHNGSTSNRFFCPFRVIRSYMN